MHPEPIRLREVPITEADYEFLLRTLSEAQSRATEIAIGVRGRVGVDHRLAELGNSAVSQIESVLRDMRKAATEESGGQDSEAFHAAGESAKIAAVPVTAAHEVGAPEQPGDFGSEHWFPTFVNDVLERYQTSGGITFETVERALAQRKAAFAKDLEIARKMYRCYPHLFHETPAQRS